ncbi:SusC/RagA family TonB-linked outer membrane protein [Dinghuibacter silviterrae]|uniref:TonB-linked SusC/RagA family outer membrane protein n=1 Tax=Dinghuibacter silviterrae TaxID=1539049 RepID=A0A4V3GM00_9BACT|nr:SusC/RagA family TonB-linked outer membrane protein [Dinghuibacter silviterrae]TDX01573.1 TonB-linked SusC/RagA family outer membrane protein [Dinghuibacter silviterrae]
MRKIVAVLLLMGSVITVAAQGKTITLQEALSRIEQRFQAKFAYEHNLLKGKTTNESALDGKTIEEVLKNVLYPNNLLFLYVNENTYSIVARDARFFQAPAVAAGAPQGAGAMSGAGASPGGAAALSDAGGARALRGQVLDETGTPLAFVNVWLKGTRVGTQTTDRGEFFLRGVSAGDTLVFTYVGRTPLAVAVLNPESALTITMIPSGKRTALDEVTVVSTGLQQLPKERVTGSFVTIGAKELSQVPTANVIQRLEGQLSGVQISVLAGDRSFLYGGAGNQLSINGGTRTTGTNDYNMQIRGTSTFMGESFPLVVVDGAITDLDLSTLNPNDIDNITFLKDAAAASIWGVRAANGVMVINTKKGRNASAPQVSFSAGTMVSGKPDLGYLRLMNSRQEIGYETELVQKGFLTAQNLDGSSYFSAGYYPHTAAALALELQAGTITQAAYQQSIDSLGAIDNTGQIRKYLLQPASNQQYDLSVSGGTGTSTYFYSASYNDEKTNTVGNEGKRLTLTLNNSWKLFKVATLSTSLKGAFFRYQNEGLSLTTLFPTSGKQTLLPYMQLVDTKGSSISYDVYNPAWTGTLSGYADWRYNYMDELHNSDDVQKDENYSANIRLDVPVYRGLSASLQYSNERLFSDHRVFYNPQTFYYRNLVNYYAGNLGLTSGGILNLINTTENNYALRGQLAYDRTLGHLHQVNAIAGSEIRQTEEGQGTSTLYGYDTQTGQSANVDFSDNGYTTVAGYNSPLTGAPAQQDKERRYLSYFGNAAYTFMERYSLSASARYDDYNNFGLQQRYRATPLWSAGAQWNLGKEAFLRNVRWLGHLGLRATYGVNGNISTSVYPFTNIYPTGNDYTTGLPTTTVINLANPELKWEKTYVTNVGVDFGLFQDRLSGSVDVYRKRGTDLLYQFPIDAALAGTIGGGYLERNASSMTGKGVDISLSGLLLSNNNWSWHVGGNLSYNTNKVTDNRFDTSSISNYTVSYAPVGIPNVVGYPTDKVFAFRNAGLNAIGMTRVYNAEGDTVSATSPVYFKDLKYAGRRTAPFFGGMNSSLRYKRFTLYALLTYQFGGVFQKPTVDNYITGFYNLNYSVVGDIARRWENPGDENKTKVPGLNSSAFLTNYSLVRYQYSDANILSSDYIRLREVSLTYQVPVWRQRIVKSASVALAVRNLGLLWRANKQGYDPDFVALPSRSNSLPAAKSFNFSLNVNF